MWVPFFILFRYSPHHSGTRTHMNDLKPFSAYFLFEISHLSIACDDSNESNLSHDNIVLFYFCHCCPYYSRYLIKRSLYDETLMQGTFWSNCPFLGYLPFLGHLPFLGLLPFLGHLLFVGNSLFI